MSATIPHSPSRSRHLTAIGSSHTAAPGPLTPPAAPAPPAPAVSAPSLALSRTATLRLDQAELFLLSLDGEMRSESPRTAYLVGLAEMHLAGLIEVLRAVTR